jgi:DNA invertase Pin-like site-specific DNA recombinase
MRYGYARISTDDQRLDRQRAALARETCDQVIEETGSGVTARKRLDKLLARLVAGDELMISEIDRFGRTTADVILTMDDLTRRDVALRVIGMRSLNITSDHGRLMADIVASLAAHERRRIHRRPAEGIAAAKAGGRHLGRPRKISGQQITEAHARLTADEPLRIVAKAYGVDVKTLRACPPAATLAQGAGHGSY